MIRSTSVEGLLGATGRHAGLLFVAWLFSIGAAAVLAPSDWAWLPFTGGVVFTTLLATSFIGAGAPQAHTTDPNTTRPVDVGPLRLIITTAVFVMVSGRAAVVAMGGCADASGTESYWGYAIGEGICLGALRASAPDARRWLRRMLLRRPGRAVAGGFVLAAVTGAVLLLSPMCLHSVRDASAVEALFMSVSAVSVTGLAVVDVPSTYTVVGQLVLLCLIQIGGLGMMLVTAFLAVVTHHQVGADNERVLISRLGVGRTIDLRRVVVGIVVFTLLLEAMGTAALYPLAPGDTWAERALAAVFHAVSAFCNAGLSNADGGVGAFGGAGSIAALVVSGLVLVGGIGYPVVLALFDTLRAATRGVRRNIGLHARVVLRTSAILVFVGALAHMSLAWTEADDVDLPTYTAEAFFHAVHARTAGFSTTDIGALPPALLLVYCGLMLIGASPGSTGGGLKTTTAATIVAVVRAEVRRQPSATLDGESLPRQVVRRALVTLALFTCAIGGTTFVLALFEDVPLFVLFFEAVSATCTVGYSTGVTSSLSDPSRLALCAAMLIGRAGLLTVALAVAGRPRSLTVQPEPDTLHIG